MTFIDRYNQCKTWHEKVLVMGLYHLVQGSKYDKWTISDTADYFHTSTGLVSENIRLHKAIDSDISITTLTRQEALRLIK